MKMNPYMLVTLQMLILLSLVALSSSFSFHNVPFAIPHPPHIPSSSSSSITTTTKRGVSSSSLSSSNLSWSCSDSCYPSSVLSRRIVQSTQKNRLSWITRTHKSWVSILHSQSHPNDNNLHHEDDEEEEEKKEKEDNNGYKNPYQDPNYPELEFIDYSDPTYSVDQGVTDDFFPLSFATRKNTNKEEDVSHDDDIIENDDEEEEWWKEENIDESIIEQMREERRRQNDLYQFETYFQNILKGGETFKGEWEVYRTSTFLPNQQLERDEYGFPLLVKENHILKVVSSGKKIQLQAYLDGIGSVPLTAIVHEERLATEKDYEDIPSRESMTSTTSPTMDPRTELLEQEIIQHQCCPNELFASDFRGPAGIMCVGNAYTLCNAVPIVTSGDSDDALYGPFSELRTEIGIVYKRMRYRIKLDYRIEGFGPNWETSSSSILTKDLNGEQNSVVQDPTSTNHPPLHLSSLTVCRETRERWPRYNEDNVLPDLLDEDVGSIDDNPKVNVDDASTAYLFGIAGAPGGLYDPPPIGSEEQESKYMMLDFEGGATALFPYMIDQDPDAYGGEAKWVTSLDWTPGRMRYQVDRKILGGVNIRGLRTLELSEVEASEADKWRPKDGGMDMRQ